MKICDSIMMYSQFDLITFNYEKWRLVVESSAIATSIGLTTIMRNHDTLWYLPVLSLWLNYFQYREMMICYGMITWFYLELITFNKEQRRYGMVSSGFLTSIRLHKIKRHKAKIWFVQEFATPLDYLWYREME
jgi:hypothetical protein